jgi:hypothetical protein
LFFSLLLPFNSYHIELPFGTSQQNTTEFIEEAPSNNLVVDAQQTHFETDQQRLEPNEQSYKNSMKSEKYSLLFIWLSAPCWFLEFCFQFFR